MQLRVLSRPDPLLVPGLHIVVIGRKFRLLGYVTRECLNLPTGAVRTESIVLL